MYDLLPPPCHFYISALIYTLVTNIIAAHLAYMAHLDYVERYWRKRHFALFQAIHKAGVMSPARESHLELSILQYRASYGVPFGHLLCSGIISGQQDNLWSVHPLPYKKVAKKRYKKMVNG